MDLITTMSATFYLYLSLTLFVAGVYLYGKPGFSMRNMGFYAVVVFSVISYLIYGIANLFTGNGIDESVVFHLRYGLHGAGFSEYSELIIKSAAVIVLSLVFLLLLLSKRIKRGSHWRLNNHIAFLLLLLSLLTNPAISDFYGLISPRLGSVHARKIHKEPFATKSNSIDFDEFYLEPSVTKAADETKNFIFIYAEGLERTYFDETIFPGLITHLRELESKSTYFTNIKQVPGTGWTIGGVVASQCGIPLFTPSHGNSMAGMDAFLPSVTCLSDLLQQEGYIFTYLGGADLDFAGKGKFFATHRFEHIAGKDELLPALADKSYASGWGLYDDSLFDLAYESFVESSKLGEKFGLFLLTLDTHHPNGHPSKSCQDIVYADGSNPMLNAVACSDYLIDEFVERIIQSPYADDIVIVILSDHLALRNTAYSDLTQKERRNLFMIIEPKVKKSTRIQRPGSALDIAPTILPFIGYEGSIGLGRNLNDSEESTSDIAYIHRNLYRWEPFISNFWDFPKIREFVEVDISQKTLRIDDRAFKIPVLVELDPDLQTTLRFEFYSRREDKKLIDHLRTLEKRKPFIIIDYCADLSTLERTLGHIGYCLLAGDGNKYVDRTKIYGTVKLTSDDIRELLELKPNFRPLRVAHAGGGIDGKTYTNSLEALDYNVKKGFLYFELDFSFTKDNRLVCIHDWKNSFNRTFGFWPKEKPSLATFELLVKNKSDYQQCTLETLANWMKQNTSSSIITDIKEYNLQGLKIISKNIPEFEKRVIPQIYDPHNYDEVKRKGYKQIIWTLYRYNGSNDDVLAWAGKFNGPFAITMPKDRAKSNLPRKLAEKRIPTYVHTVNTLEEANKFANDFGVTEIYTDFLRPES